MLGIGTWRGNVNTIFFNGEVSLSIEDNNGSYGFSMQLPEEIKKIPEVSFKSFEEDGNTLTAKAEVSLMPGKTVDVVMNFDGDTMNGVLKIPFIGKIDLNEFKRV